MRFASVIEEMAATPSYLLFLFVILTVCMHAAFIWFGHLSDISWKRVDYVWVSTAVLGVLSSAYTADRYLSLRYGVVEAIRAESAYNSVRDSLERARNPGTWRMAMYSRTQLLPPDLESARSNLDGLLGVWISFLPESMGPPFLSLHDLASDLEAMDRQYFGPDIGDLLKAVKRYEYYRARANGLAISSDRSPAADLKILVLGVPLLTFSLALRLAKVSGELANAKRKAKEESKRSRQ
jgi:hypothetical protein